MDPISILSNDALETVIKRAHIRMPPQPYGLPHDVLRERLLKVLSTFLYSHISVSFCRPHYIEYLVGLIARHKIDPIAIFDLVDVQQEIKRRGKDLPDKGEYTTDEEYRNICAKVCQISNPSIASK